jgi:hypothetical protein
VTALYVAPSNVVACFAVAAAANRHDGRAVMKRTLRALVLIGVLGVSTVPVQASSTPVIAGFVSMIELCPQDWCGAAIFWGAYVGRIGLNPFAVGKIAVAVNHGPLPVETGECTPIPYGQWTLQTGFRQFRGTAQGELCYNGDNTFAIAASMTLTEGGTGTMAYQGTLDHNVFPPTNRGFITQ